MGRALFSLLFVGIVGTITATGPVLTAIESKAPPKIDGTISPGEWPDATKVGPMLDPVSGKVSPDPSDVWISYDKKSIYVAFYCHDRDPAQIRGREIIPNSRFQGEDTVNFSINTFGNNSFDQENEFTANVLGTQSENIAGGRTGKREWRGEWVAKTSRVADGWICEMSIPWTILNYPFKANAKMNVNFSRVIGRSLFEQRWANANQNPLPENMGTWTGVNPPEPPKPRTQFLTYTSPEVTAEGFQNRVGLDARYAFTPQFNGLMSLSPDFRNVEDVVAGIDFVRTERFLGERRPFFNEGGDFFDLTGQFAYGRMFYSRRIQEFDLGAKFYGQLNNRQKLGALYTNNFDGQKTAVVNFEQISTPVSGHKVFGTFEGGGKDNSSFGASMYTRKGTVGFDAGFSAEKDGGSKTDTAGTAAVSYQRPNVFAIARYSWVTPEFNPSLGFIPWTDRRGGYVYLTASNEFRKGPVRSGSFNMSSTEFRTYDGDIQEGGWDSSAALEFRNDMQVNFGRSRYRYFGSLDDTAWIGLNFNISNRFKRFGVGYQEGTLSDQPSRQFDFGSSFRIGKNLDLSLRKTILRQAAGLANETLTQQTIGTLAYQMSPADLVSSRFVWNGDNLNAYFSFRHTGFAGTDYYLIVGDPNSPTTVNRLAAKIVWSF
ncbi:MAG: DUF5916 domain-containing protein [Armatimonadota bacterium]